MKRFSSTDHLELLAGSQAGVRPQSPVVQAPVAGIEPCSLIDYPGHIAAVVFLQGCNFNCSWCHNRQLIPCSEALLDPRALDGFLASRRDFLDGVVVTGGEPTQHSGLGDLLKRIKGLGYRVKLDTNGSQPEHLAALLDARLVDFVAMDLKAPLDDAKRQAKFCGLSAKRGPQLVKQLRASLQILQSKALGGLNLPAHEIRTTCSPGLNLADLAAIAGDLADASPWALQVWRPMRESQAPISGGPAALGVQTINEWVSLLASAKPKSCITIRG